MSRVLITGGAGFIGYHLAKYHQGKGDEVLIFDNFYKKKTRDKEFLNLIKKKNVRFFNVNLNNKINLKKFNYPYIDTVYHLAAINGTSLFYKIPLEVFTSNVRMLINFIDWLKTKKIKKIIYSSSSEVYAQSYFLNLIKIPTNEEALIAFKYPIQDRFSYGLSKFFGEYLISGFLKTYKINGCTVRFHNIYGPRMGNKHVIPQLINRAKQTKKVLKIYGGKQTRAFCYVDDAVKYLYLLSKKNKFKHKLYNIGNEKEEIQIKNLIKIILNKMKKKLIIKDLGEPKGSVRRRCPNMKRLIKYTKHKPTVDLESGLDKIIFS